MHHEEDDLNLLESMGYEERDVHVGKKGLAGAFLGFVFLTVLVVVTWVFIGLVDRTYSFMHPPRQVPERVVQPPKDYPVVQSDVTARTDIITLRRQEEAKESKLGWVDKDKGIAQIPVESAIKIVAARGLPVKPGATDVPEAGNGVQP